MKQKLYLIWNCYKTNEKILIGSLEKKNNKYYYQNNHDALRAEQLGCFLPFPYSEQPIEIDNLPLFFQNRMLNEERNKSLSVDEFEILTETKGLKNSDNFLTISDEELGTILGKKM